MQGAWGKGRKISVRFWINWSSLKTVTLPYAPLPYTFSHGSNFLNFFFDLGSLFSR